MSDSENQISTTEVVQAFADDHELAWEKLVHVAASMYDKGEPAVEWDEKVQDEENALRPAFENGWLRLEDGQLAFADNEILREALADLLKERFLQVWGDPDAFVQALRYLLHAQRQIPAAEGLGGRMLSTLHNEYGKDVLERVRAAAADSDKNRFWSFSKPFGEALPHLLFELEEIVAALAAIRQVFGIDAGSTAISAGIERRCRDHRQFWEDLLDKLEEDPSSGATAFLPSVLRGIAAHDFEGAYDHAIELTQTAQAELVRAGVYSLGRFDYEAAGRKNLLTPTLEHLESLEPEATTEQAVAMVRGYHRLRTIWGGQTAEGLRRLAGRSEPEVQQQIAEVLYMLDADVLRGSWPKRVLMKLTDVQPEHSQILGQVDYSLSVIAQSDPSFALDFIEGWFLAADADVTRLPAPLSDILSSTYAALFNNFKEELEERLTQWLNEDDRRFHKLAGIFLAEGQIHPVTWHLSKDVLDGLALQDVKYVTYKVLAYAREGHRLSTLIFSLLRREPKREELTHFVEGLFLEHIVLNYYGSATEYLKKKEKEGSEVEKKVACRVLRQVEAYYEAREKLPRLSEFKPPTLRLQKFQTARQKQMQATAEAVRKSRPSPFRELFREVPTKGGSGFYAEMAEGKTERVPFQTHSVETEVPRDEHADPVGLAHMRWRWINLEREDI